jgi:hypothetical protein
MSNQRLTKERKRIRAALKGVQERHGSSWKLGLCNAGENCWCRLILPKGPLTADQVKHDVNWVVADGSVDQTLAKYLVALQPETLVKLLDLLDYLVDHEGDEVVS